MFLKQTTLQIYETSKNTSVVSDFNPLMHNALKWSDTL